MDERCREDGDEMSTVVTGNPPAVEARADVGARPQAATGRLYYLDYLRAGTVALVMLHHTAITYGASGSWYYTDASHSKLVVALLTWFVGVNQAWFMSFLYFLSGYLSLPSLTRKGGGQYALDRLRRFGIPLVVYAFGISPVVTWLAQGSHPALLTYWEHQYLTFHIIDTGVLWFIWGLLLMDCLLVVWARYFSRGIDLKARPATPFPSRWRLVAFAVVLGLAAFAVRLVIPAGAAVLFGLQLGYFPAYVAMFIVGLLAWRHHWLDAIPDSAFRFARWSAIIGIAVFLPMLVVGLLLGGTGTSQAGTVFDGGLHLQALMYALWEPWVLVGMSIVLLRWGQRRLNSPSPLWQGWASASYVAYIIQPLVLVPLGVWLTGSTLPALVKFPLVGAATILGAYALARALRLIPQVRTVIG
jgi:glucans biosynthesis protein C